jgi:cytochrome b
MTEPTGFAAKPVLERVWSIPVRIAHWTLATLVLIDLFNDPGGEPHRLIGYAALAVVVLRLSYGTWSSHEASRVGLPRVRECSQHLRGMLRGRVVRERGHNPLGALMALLIWTLVVLLALTGWVSRWDRYWGEDWPIEIHAWLAQGLQACIVLHLVGVLTSSLIERQNLVRGMVSGNKYVDAGREGLTSEEN